MADEIILTTVNAGVHTCPLGGGTSPRNCGHLSCMFWASTTRMDQIGVGYCSLATIARKICEDELRINELLGANPGGYVSEVPGRRIDRPVMVGDDIEVVSSDHAAPVAADTPPERRTSLRVLNRRRNG